jgi:hypothetical protein
MTIHLPLTLANYIASNWYITEYAEHSAILDYNNAYWTYYSEWKLSCARTVRKIK